MESYCKVQTPLIYQYGSQYADNSNSQMFIQNSFEWSHQTWSTPSTDTQSIFQHSCNNLASYNPNNTVNDFNSFAFDQSCFELNNLNNNPDNFSHNNNQTSAITDEYFEQHLAVLGDCFTENGPIQDEEIYDLNLDDSLKNVLNEIESIPSVFLEDVSSASPSSVSSVPDQEILSPELDLNLWSNVPLSACGSPTSNFNVPETIECDSSVSSGESEVFSDDISGREQVKRVNKSGRVSKRESNKVAAVRYRQKKSKQRDQLFQECELYGKKNEELKEKISDIEQQIGYIKSLLMQALAQKK